MSNSFFGDEGPQPPKVLTAPLEIYANLRPLLDNNIPLTLRFSTSAASDTRVIWSR